ncbi:MAG: hypothetical protein COV44_11150 [Deltaproteobacteria bacterium CG11_big_fil_rev_8_21_14_0_20_45_16]|nr:MAG: hypothetical protein COV44_11150 [Deltaproteobacteria bacterium CG11_big_fil_rev_8_21_14_0_20_45_16]
MLRDYLPPVLNKELFGDRAKYGQKPMENDTDWKKWQSVYTSAYFSTQKSSSIQRFINNAGYKVLNGFAMADKVVADLGPGNGYSIDYFDGKPKSYVAVDVCEEFFPIVAEKCEKASIDFSALKVRADHPVIELPPESLDCFVSFYSLEHIHPLKAWLDEIFSKVKPGGYLIGAIPAEGGVGWALGRMMTSKGILKRRYGLDIRKIVCWEHPNMCDEILANLSSYGRFSKLTTWPARRFPYDLSLIIRFAVQKN